MSDYGHRDVTSPGVEDSPIYGERRSRVPGAGEPAFTPLDIVAGIVMVAMIWGPLAAGAFRF